MKHVILCTPYMTLLYVVLQIVCNTAETATSILYIVVLKTHFTMLLWLSKLSIPLYATQGMNSAFCTALNVVYVYLSTLVSELKKTLINTFGYQSNGSHFAYNIFNFIILLKPVFILHGAFWIYFSYEHPTDNKSTLIQLTTLLMLATK